jgi:enterochelin esterase family protein
MSGTRPSGRGRILGNERTAWVYTPPGYDPAAGPYAFVLLFDGWAYANLIPTATILDNLIGAGRLPPTVALLLGNPDPQARQRELGCHEPFVAFVASELLPWVRGRYAVAADPARSVVGGSSRGGLAAAFAGLRRPALFGRVLCQSGAFWFKPDGDPEPEWLARPVAATPLRPLRFHLDVGLLEVGVEDDDMPNMLTASRHMRDVLRAKGYAVDYSEFSGGHSYSCWEVALPEGLLALLGLDTVQGA